MVFSAALMLAGPYLIKIAIDDGISQNRVDVLTIAAILYPATLVGVWLLTYGQTRLVSGIGQRLLGKLRLDMFVHLQRLPAGFFTKRQVGSLMSRVINDISILNEFISVGALQILADVLLLIAIAGAMLVLDPGLALMIFLTFPVTFIAARIYAVKAHQAFRHSRQTVAEVNASLQENIAGVRVAQSFAREDRNIAQFGQINDRNFSAAMRAGVLAASLTPAVEILRARMHGPDRRLRRMASNRRRNNRRRSCCIPDVREQIFRTYPAAQPVVQHASSLDGGRRAGIRATGRAGDCDR